MTRTAPTLARLVAGAAALLSGASLASASPGWTAPQELGAGYAPTLSLDAGGSAVLAYGALPTCLPCSSAIEALVRPAGGSWGGPEHVGDTGYRGLYGMQAAADDHGGVVAVWEPGESSSGGGNLMTATRGAGGPWSTPKDLSDPSYVASYRLAVDRDGKAIAVWDVEPYTVDGGHVFAAVRPAGASEWQKPLELADPPVAGHVGVAVDDAGRAVAIWQESGGAPGPRVVSSARPAGGSWGTAAPVVSAEVEDPQVGLDAAGDAVVAYVRDGIPRVVQRAASSATWSAPEGLAPAQGASGLQLAVGADGSAAVVWVDADHVWASVRTARGAWGGAERLSDSVAFGPAVTVTDDGVVVAAWSASSGAVESAVHAPGGTWSSPRTMGAGNSPSLDSDAAGDVGLAWSSDASILTFAAWDATPPRISGVQVPATATAGQAVSVAMAAPADTWSAVPDVGWDFGDGATAGGASASHVYAAPGVYTVTARAGDAAGNLATQTRRVTVAAAPSPGIAFDPSGPPGTVGSVGGVLVVALPGAGAGSTPKPPATGAVRHRRAVTMRVAVPALTAGHEAVIGVRLSRVVHGALVRVQLRRGVRYLTVAHGRVSGRRVPVALAFASPGRYLVRIQLREAGARRVSRVVPVTVRG